MAVLEFKDNLMYINTTVTIFLIYLIILKSSLISNDLLTAMGLTTVLPIIAMFIVNFIKRVKTSIFTYILLSYAIYIILVMPKDFSEFLYYLVCYSLGFLMNTMMTISFIIFYRANENQPLYKQFIFSSLPTIAFTLILILLLKSTFPIVINGKRVI